MKRFTSFFILSFVTTPLHLFATIIIVPTDYTTIQLAILASADGDTILVEPGTYYENINFRGHKVVLTSRFYINHDTSYICSTIIDGSQPVHPDTATCIILNSGENANAVIQGFTITGGAGTVWYDIHGAGIYREGGAIITEFSSPIIRWNHIQHNLVTNNAGVNGTGGGAIRCGDGSPLIYNNVITSNKAGYGGGLVFNYCDNAVVKNNLIVYNSGGQDFGGGAIWAGGESAYEVFAENNTIANNHVTGSGTYGGKGGAFSVFTITLITKNNIIWGNTQSSGNSFATFFGGSIEATYSDLDFSYSGLGNVSDDPLFADTTTFLLSSVSPCIDEGDPAEDYNDLIIAEYTAMFPSQGTEVNDMGAYGGPLTKILANCDLIFSGIPDESTMETDPVIYFSSDHSVVTLQLTLMVNSNVTINFYDLNGRRLDLGWKGNVVRGPHQFQFNIRKFPAGIYCCGVITGKRTASILFSKF